MHSQTAPSLPTLQNDVFDSLPESVRTSIRFLEEVVQKQSIHIISLESHTHKLEFHIHELETRIKDLEDRLSKDSSNSNKPPSSDGLKRKPQSLRVKSGKKPGGQKGHVGKNLQQIDNPNVIIVHKPESCKGCGLHLTEVKGHCVEKRQVFDVPQPKIEVTEHQVEEKKCPCCGEVNRAFFPEKVKGPVQYGDRLSALAVYFTHQHFIPVARVCEILKDIFGASISAGTCANLDKCLFNQLSSFECSLKKNLIASKVLHFDETGMRCEKKMHWLHVASSKVATLYTMYQNRGKEAMDVAGILPQFKGIAVHDYWTPYFAYKQIKHSLCNAHHLRELTFIFEQQKEEWAKHIFDLLLEAKQEVEKYLEQGMLPSEVLTRLLQAYAKFTNDGLSYHALLPPLPKGKRGKQPQRAGKNLLDRLTLNQSDVLRFIYDFSVPFTNNQGEQDIRMAKLKQKISGCFRVFSGGEIFCRIRSYISTARKQGWKIWHALEEAIKGNPFHLVVNT